MESQNVALTTLFHQALVNPGALTKEDFDKLLSKYPYSQPLHFAYERKKAMEEDTDVVSASAVLLARNPTWLQEYIHKPVEKASEIEIVDDDYVPFEDTVVEEILEEEMTPLEEEPVEHEENEASLETLMHEAIGGGDYFALHKHIEEEEVADEMEETTLDTDKEEENVSLYNDELMPYSFRWWLHKTRLEHADTYQPFASPHLPVADKAPFDAAKIDEVILDQQIRENIFRLQNPEDKLSEEVKKKEVQYSRVDKTTELIERFIREEPQIQPPLPDQLTGENKARKSSEEQFDLVTETLATIYVDQAMYVKAIEVYKKLILKFPEKKSYFATQIKNLEEKLY